MRRLGARKPLRHAATLALALALPPAGSRAAATDGPGARAPFALTVDQLFAWQAKGALADDRNVAHVPLAPRMIDPGPGPDPEARLDPKARVLIAPDGMNDFASYLTPQPRFNLYTFTHWAQVDILAWFGGTARHSVIVPARPWVETAHRNGVKVIGTVFFAPIAWGGSPSTVASFLHEDGRGHFPAADRLIAIARHYGFDGWLINEETDIPAPVAARMKRFMAYLTRIAPEPMEIHWYDAMLPDGRVAWQNAFNAGNASLLQDGRTRVSDAMFLNYQWTPEGLRQGATLARSLGRDPYSLFIGADLWPARNNAQAAFRNRHWLRDLRVNGDGPALGSIALFAPNFNLNAGGEFGDFRARAGDVTAYYDAEIRLFAGDDRNMAAGDSAESAHTNAWEGLAALVPARTTILKLPFATSFNTGHGLVNAREGRVIGGPWHDMSRQDPLPSWQFAFTPGARIEIGYDFARPYQGGSSLRVAPAPAQHARVTVPLFLAALPLGAEVSLDLTTRTDSPGYALVLDMTDGSSVRHLLQPGNGWRRQHQCLRQPGRRIRRISIEIAATDEATNPLNIGAIGIHSGCPLPNGTDARREARKLP